MKLFELGDGHNIAPVAGQVQSQKLPGQKFPISFAPIRYPARANEQTPVD
jgi:hypothetical protein